MQQALIFFKTQPIILSIQRRTNIERALISVKTQYKAKPPVNNCGSGSRTNACSNFTCSNGLKSNTQFYSKHRNSHWSRNLQWLTPARFIDPIWLTGFPNIRKYKYFDRKTLPSWIIFWTASPPCKKWFHYTDPGCALCKQTINPWLSTIPRENWLNGCMDFL